MVATAAVIAVLAVLAGILSHDGSEVGATTERVTNKGSATRERQTTPPRREKLPVVPLLVGQTPDRVRQELDPLGIETRFIGRCEGIPPAGRVVLQVPPPGRRLHLPQVRLHTDAMAACSDGEAGRGCAAADLSVEADGDESDYAGSAGMRVLWLNLKNKSKTACQLDSTGRIELVPLEGQENPIRGNPATLTIDWKLQPGETFYAEWFWNSWCGKRGRWLVALSMDGMEASGEVSPPDCLDYRFGAPAMFGISSDSAPV
jgi:Protein of unknown function (DUF4232)